jgi:parallel beta-helix repeat protein
VPRYFSLPIAVLMAVTGAAMVQAAGAQSILVVSATATGCGGHPPAFTKIQAAVNAAAAGSTILVCAGTYAEQVVVTKNNLTIRGSDQDAEREADRNGKGANDHRLSVLRPGALPDDPGSLNTGAARKAMLLVNGATGVTIANLTIDGSHADAGTTTFPDCSTLGFTLGIYYRNSSGAITSTHTTNIRSAVRCSAGIRIESGGGGAAKVAVNGNTVDNYGQAGVVCAGESSACTVTENTLRGRGPVDDDDQVGIYIREGAAGRVRLNSVSGHLCTNPSCGPDPINELQAAGIFILVAARGSHISENRVADKDIGIVQFLSPDCCTISENHLTNNRFFGIDIQDGNGTTSENEISGGQIGIGVTADFVNTIGVLRKEKIRGTTVAPVKEFKCCGFKATAIVKKD